MASITVNDLPQLAHIADSAMHTSLFHLSTPPNREQHPESSPTGDRQIISNKCNERRSNNYPFHLCWICFLGQWWRRRLPAELTNLLDVPSPDWFYVLVELLEQTSCLIEEKDTTRLTDNIMKQNDHDNLFALHCLWTFQSLIVYNNLFVSNCFLHVLSV